MYKIANVKDEVEVNKIDGKTYILIYKNRTWKISPLVYMIMSLFDGEKSKEELIDYYFEKTGKTISDRYIDKVVSFCSENKLLEGLDDTSAGETKPKSNNKYMWLRITLLPEKVVARLACLKILFEKRILIVNLTILSIWYIYLTLRGYFNELSRIGSMNMNDLPKIAILFILISFFHEIGHATALAYGKEKPGQIGMAVYLFMPVLFSNVNGAWRLDKWKRIRVDIGGIYFELLLSFWLYVINQLFFHNTVINQTIFVGLSTILLNFNPFVKMDGYWILSDFLGVTDMKKTMKEMLTFLFKKKKTRQLEEMKRYELVILGCYMIFFGFFMLYFVNIMILSYKNACLNLYHNLNEVMAMKLSLVNILVFLKNNFMNLLLFGFMIKILTGLIKKVYLRLQS